MTDTPEATLRAYIRAFETLDPEAALPFYHLPSMFIAPQGVFAAPDAGTVRALLAQFMGQLRAQSYRHTDVSGLEVRAVIRARILHRRVRALQCQRSRNRAVWLHLHHAKQRWIVEDCRRGRA